jgi:radical SAM superfamily enzyme YgiQ (UPF0313 family)
MDLRAPSIGLAQLNGSVKSSGMSSKAFDLNILLWRELCKIGYGKFWSYADTTLVEAEKYSENYHIIHPHLERILLENIPSGCKVIGVSLFCNFSFIPLESVLTILRDNFPISRIIIGGPGISIRNMVECDTELATLKQRDLYDDFMFGDGDFVIPEYINGIVSSPALNSYTQDPRSAAGFSAAIPDYTDFDLSHYPKNHLDVENLADGPNGWLYMTGSKGCVRDCTFCDVGAIWGKYKTKTGSQIAREMIHQNITVGANKFRFTDSLLNGNLKVLREMCEELVKYPKRMLWHGQYICRHISQQSPEFYDLMHQAGLDLVSIGIESGSESVRGHMRKNFSNESLYYTLDQCKRVGIKVVPLMMVGYPTETEEDFVETLNFIDRLSEYREIVVDLNLNNPTRILPGSPLADSMQFSEIHYDSLIKDSEFTSNWWSEQCDYKTRIERFFRFHNQLNKNGFERSYAGGDFKYYEEEYLKQPDPDRHMLKIIHGVIDGEYIK